AVHHGHELDAVPPAAVERRASRGWFWIRSPRRGREAVGRDAHARLRARLPPFARCARPSRAGVPAVRARDGASRRRRDAFAAVRLPSRTAPQACAAARTSLQGELLRTLRGRRQAAAAPAEPPPRVRGLEAFRLHRRGRRELPSLEVVAKLAAGTHFLRPLIGRSPRALRRVVVEARKRDKVAGIDHVPNQVGLLEARDVLVGPLKEVSPTGNELVLASARHEPVARGIANPVSHLRPSSSSLVGAYGNEGPAHGRAPVHMLLLSSRYRTGGALGFV